MVRRIDQRRSWEIRASSRGFDDHEVVTGKSVPVEESREEIRTLAGWADLKGNDIVLDAGAGSGRLCHELEASASGAEIIALDVSHGMLRRLRAGGSEACCVVGDVMHLPFRAHVFTLVVCIGVLASLPPRDGGATNLRESIAAINEFNRVLKTDGRLCIDFGNILNPSWIAGHAYDSVMSRIWPTSGPIFQYAITLPEAESILSRHFRITNRAAFDFSPVPIHTRLLGRILAEGLVMFWRRIGKYLCPRSRLLELILPDAYSFKVVKERNS